MGPSSIIGVDASLTSAPLSPRPPAPPHAHKVTLGGERPAPPPLRPADAQEHWAAFLQVPPLCGAGASEEGPGEGGQRSRAQAAIMALLGAQGKPSPLWASGLCKTGFKHPNPIMV